MQDHDELVKFADEIEKLEWEDRQKVFKMLRKPVWKVTLNGVEVPIGDTLDRIFMEMYLPTLDREKYGL